MKGKCVAASWQWELQAYRAFLKGPRGLGSIQQVWLSGTRAAFHFLINLECENR